MPKAPIRFDAETATGAALAALQKLGATLPAECLSVQRLCAETNWSRDRVYDLLRDGEIVGFAVGGRRYIVTSSVREFIARRVADPTVIRYPNPLVKPPSQPAPEPPRMDRRRRKRRTTEPIAA